VTTSPTDDPARWGRVADDGTVFLRTTDGEREVGCYQAGDAAAALAYFALRYADLATEVGLLETRFAAGRADAAHTKASATRILESLPTASVVGDIEALERRLRTLLEAVASRTAQEHAERAERNAAAVAQKRALVDEAEALAESGNWKQAGDRLREIATHWREVRIDRRTDGELWARLRTARATFTARRSAHFESLGEERAAVRRRKEKLIAEAEELAGSTDWKTTSARLKSLMREWKEAGRADRATETELWTRFRAAQDSFFSRLSEQNAERDAAQRDNQTAREALAAEAEAIDVSDVDAAQAKLRAIQDRWDKTGPVPRPVAAALDERLARVGRSIRQASEDKWREASVATSPLVIRLRESVTKLEARLARSRAAGDDAEVARTEEALATQREWLAQAERS
jgi:hypothetical protein